MAKVVVTQPMEFSSAHITRLNKLGDVTFYDDLPATPKVWLERCKGADIICTGKLGFRDTWRELRNVFVSVPFVGVGFLEPITLRGNNVSVSSSPGCNRHAVSEWVIAMMLTIFRELDTYLNVVELPTDKSPEPTTGLAYKNVTILGKGNVGSRVGAVCEALEMNVTYFQRGDNLADKTKDADVIVDTLSLNPGTINLLNRDFFAALKDGAVFITVTDDIVDTEAMLSALDSGKLSFVVDDAGGILMGNTNDLLYQRLLKHPKVFVTPHISYNTDVTHQISNDMMIDNVEAWLKGEPIHVIQ